MGEKTFQVGDLVRFYISGAAHEGTVVRLDVPVGPGLIAEVRDATGRLWLAGMREMILLQPVKKLL